MTEHWLDGKLHWAEGPAVRFSDGGEEWFLNDQLHRRDGPAVIYEDGSKAWFLYGKPVSAQEVFDQLTDEEKEQAIWNMDEWR